MVHLTMLNHDKRKFMKNVKVYVYGNIVLHDR